MDVKRPSRAHQRPVRFWPDQVMVLVFRHHGVQFVNMRQLSYLLVALINWPISSVRQAECADLGSATKWALVDRHQVVLYRGHTAIAVLDIPLCSVLSSSDIKLVKDYVCDGDKIVVDKELCYVRRVEKP